ncbi:MAG: response regulator transcription factor [Zavarzinella sp.]
MKRSRIVIVEDEPAIRRGIADTLRLHGYEVVETCDGANGLIASRQEQVDLILLDLMLPQMDGLQVLKELRKTHPTRGVIILTARGTEDDRVRGLKLGADDYVIKPFSARELLARVEAMLRRIVSTAPKVAQTVHIGELGTLDLFRRELLWNCGQRIELSETETSLLQYLLSHRHRAIGRDELLEKVWGISPEGLETRTVDMHIARLRAKLKEPSGQDTPETIITVRSTGYMVGPGIQIPVEAK